MRPRVPRPSNQPVAAEGAVSRVFRSIHAFRCCHSLCCHFAILLDFHFTALSDCITKTFHWLGLEIGGLPLRSIWPVLLTSALGILQIASSHWWDGFGFTSLILNRATDGDIADSCLNFLCGIQATLLPTFHLAFCATIFFNFNLHCDNLAFCSGAPFNAFNAFITPVQLAFCGEALEAFTLHCYNLAFCSGALFTIGIIFTPLQLAFCGGAWGGPNLHCYNLAFCSGAPFPFWVFFTPIQLAFCGGALDTILRHCYSLAFCSGALHTLDPFCTPFTLDYCGVVRDLVTPPSNCLAFCSGALCTLQWHIVWCLALGIWLFLAQIVVIIWISHLHWTAPEQATGTTTDIHWCNLVPPQLDLLRLKSPFILFCCDFGNQFNKARDLFIHIILVFPFWILLLLAALTLEHSLGHLWTFLLWQQINFHYFYSGFDRFCNFCHDRILGALHLGCIPGPKSGHSGFLNQRWKLALCILLFTATMISPEWSGGEGHGPSMGPVETPPQWELNLIESLGVKQHGRKPTTCFGTSSWPMTHSKVVKRSLKRALRRFEQHGMAWYRGQCLTDADFPRFSGGFDYSSSPSERAAPSTAQCNNVRNCNRQQAPRNRISSLLWNAGGLSNHKLDELRTWMELQNIHIGVFPESLWTFTNEWSDSKFHYIHTGDPQLKGQGILVMIAANFCSASHIQWQELQVGRLLHVRLRLRNRDADLLAGYQHTQRRTQQCLQEREKWWQCLDDTLHSLPTRNTLLLMGDFNCNVPSAPAFAGPAAFKWNGRLHTGHMHSDAGRFLSILKHHGVATLNTWDAKQGPTYVHADVASRIDFFCTRLHSVDGCSKQVKALWQAPFLDQMQVGHVPLLCSFAMRWVPPGASMQQRLTYQQKQMARTAYHDCTEQWRQFAQHAATLVPSCFAAASASDSHTVDHMHAHVMEAFRKHFPVQKLPKTILPWKRNQQIIHTKWDHRRWFLTPRCTSVTSVLRCWFHVARFYRLKRLHRRMAYRARAIQFEDITQAASRAAAQHDMHTMFKIINNNSPKQPRKRIQLRTANGHIATPAESAEILTRYVSELWAGPSKIGVQFSDAPGVPFTLEQLIQALSRIPVCKATAPPFAPGAVWRTVATELAPWLYSQLQLWWSSPDPYIPKDWKDGWLVMIPKPQKPPVTPGNLRPLAMQCPIGKCIMGILIHQAVSQAHDSLISWPIFAYMPGRSTMDSILRVAAHCSQVRQLVGSQRTTPHQRACSPIRYKICGGFQIFVDIQRAFDAVSRAKLFRRLHELGIGPAHVNLISRWHENTEYHVQTDAGPRTAPIGRGLRQGCKAAPALWNFFIILFFQDLSAVVPISWIRSCVTVYADDCHIGGIYRSERDFKRLLEMIGILFKTLQSLDMTVNPAKTVALLAISGTSFRNFKREVVHRDHIGEYVEIAIPDAAPMKIHLQQRAKYLGVIMSYHTFEKDTLKHRTTLAHLGFSRLRSWLCGRHLNIQRRYHLWLSCIYPILTYGIFAMMQTHHTILQLQKTLHGMLRKILRDFAFLTQHTHAQALEQHCIPAPLTLMRGTAVRLHQSVTQRCQNLVEYDIMHTCNWTHLEALIRLFDSVQETNSRAGFTPAVVEAITSGPRFRCSICDFCTDDVSHFRRHCTQEHQRTMQRTHFALAHHSAVDGLPTCQHCQMSFTTWRSFQIHLDRGCQALWRGPCSCTPSEHLPSVALLSAPDFMQPSFEAVRGLRLLSNEEMQLFLKNDFGGSVLHIVQNRAWEQMAQEHRACEYLTRRCFLCERQFTRIQELNAHFRQFHSDLWHGVPEKAIQLSNLYANDPPCGHCGSPFKTHICPVFVQLAVMLLHGAALDEPNPECLHDTRQRCELCLEILPTPADLAQHLQTAHQLHGLHFNASRDVLPDSTACSHCGVIFQTVDGVKSHVVQGRCKHFDPRAAAETLEVKAEMKQACLDGKLSQYLRSASTRMHLTIRCQMCGKGYSRAADLAGHLQTAHSRLWRQAIRLTQILVSLIYEPGNCCCNPSIGHKRTAHICIPLRQIAMSFHRMTADPFVPVCITDDMLLQLFTNKLERGVRFLLESTLTSREFAKCWTDPALILFFRTRCFQCGQVHSPADLCLHVREAHFTSHPTVAFFMERFLIVLHSLNQNDHQCNFCDQVFNLPAHLDTSGDLARRFDLVQSHFKGHCPSALQLAILFARILHGGRLAHEQGGCRDLSTDPGHIPAVDAGAGQRLTAASQSQTTEAPESRCQRSEEAKVKVSARGRRKRPSASPPSTTDIAGGASRSGIELAAKKRLFCDVFQQSARRCLGPPHQRNADVEELGGESCQHGSQATTEATPDEKHAQRTLGQSGSDCSGEGPGQVALGFNQEWPHLTGQVVAISPVESQHPSAGTQSSPTNLHGENDGAHPGASRDDPRAKPHFEVQRSESAWREPSNTMAATTESSLRYPTRTVHTIVQQHGVDSAGHQPQDAYPAPIQPGQLPSGTDWQTPGQRTRQRDSEGSDQAGDLIQAEDTVQTLLPGFYKMRLQNTSHWCYANSSLSCLLWSLLCLTPFDMTAWGQRFAVLHDFLHRHCLEPVALARETWFQQILHLWGHELGQQDCAEFFNALLTWLRPPAYDMRWERRVQNETQIEVVDISTQYMPFHLQFDLQMLSQSQVALTDLVKIWRQAQGMTTALLCAPQLLCIHLDRINSTEDAHMFRTECSVELDCEVRIPVFMNSGLRLEEVTYVPVAAAAHLGSDQAGHYRAALKMAPSVLSQTEPVRWLLTDDDVAPVPVWHLPPWFVCQTTLIIAARVDCLHLPMYSVPYDHVTPASSSEARPMNDLTPAESTQMLLNLMQSQAVSEPRFHVLPTKEKPI